jgi:hypothetical protein
MAQRVTGGEELIKARRVACTTPHLCFEFGDDVVCPPCENLGKAILGERKRCAAIVRDCVYMVGRIQAEAIAGKIEDWQNLK